MAEVNYATTKKFLTETGLRASGEAVKKFQKVIKEFAEGYSKALAEKVEKTGRKTITIKDFE